MTRLEQRIVAAVDAFAGDPQALAPDQLGIIATYLALEFPLWVRRRKTTHRYVDDTTVDLRISIDFRLPAADRFPATARPERGQLLYVPLDIATKTSLIRFSVRDEEGNALSLQNTRENTALATAGMNAVVNGLAGTGSRPAIEPDQLRPELEKIIAAPGDTWQAAVEAALGPGELLGQVLAEHDEYRDLLEKLANGFLMLVPVEYNPCLDRVLKLEYRVVQEWSGRGRRSSTRRLANELASIGWLDKVQDFEPLRIGWAQGSHFEFEAPEEVELAEARLDTVQFDERFDDRVQFRRRVVVYDRPQVDLNVSPRVVHDPHDADDASLQALMRCRYDTASVRLRLAPPLTGVFAAAVLTSMVISVLLWLVFARLPHLDGQTSSAVLLLLPALLAAYLIRPGEHAFATRLLLGVRLLALLVGLFALAVATIIGAGVIKREAPPPPTTRFSCTSESDIIGPSRRPAVRLRSLDCASVPRATAAAEANPNTERVVKGIAIAATTVTFVLLIGFVRTSFADWRRGRKEPHEQPTSEDDTPLIIH
ncbi:MAG: hypothetical protein ACRDPC_20245 [Solirubrobacteraceae bacterium]